MENQWHLSKSIPIGLIVTVLLQLIVFTVFLTRLDNKVEVLEQWKIETNANRFTSSDAILHDYRITQNRTDIIQIYNKLDDIARDISAIKIALGVQDSVSVVDTVVKTDGIDIF
jgi:hypothetical protein